MVLRDGADARLFVRILVERSACGTSSSACWRDRLASRRATSQTDFLNRQKRARMGKNETYSVPNIKEKELQDAEDLHRQQNLSRKAFKRAFGSADHTAD